MTNLIGNTFTSSNQFLASYHHMAALGAGILFVLESVLLGTMVFIRNQTSHARRPSPMDK